MATLEYYSNILCKHAAKQLYHKLNILGISSENGQLQKRPTAPSQIPTDMFSKKHLVHRL